MIMFICMWIYVVRVIMILLLENLIFFDLENVRVCVCIGICVWKIIIIKYDCWFDWDSVICINEKL